MPELMPLPANPGLHAVVVPLFGHQACQGLESYLQSLLVEGFDVVLVDNNPEPALDSVTSLSGSRLLQN